MISAVLFREGNDLTGCRLEGHSGWARSGHDIVCAAVSILGTTCVNSLETVCGIIPTVSQDEDGILTFDLPPLTEEDNQKAQILMKALEQGLRDLMNEYPRHVTLSMMKRRKQE